MRINQIEPQYNFSQCPYNTTHKFDSCKYFHHINRCKDGQKIKYMYQSCQYNSLHIIKKQDIEQHQNYCPDGVDSRRKIQALRQAYEVHNKIQQQEKINKNTKLLEQCNEDCICILEMIQPYLNMIDQIKRKQLKELLSSYKILWKKQERLRKQNKQ